MPSLSTSPARRIFGPVASRLSPLFSIRLETSEGEWTYLELSTGKTGSAGPGRVRAVLAIFAILALHLHLVRSVCVARRRAAVRALAVPAPARPILRRRLAIRSGRRRRRRDECRRAVWGQRDRPQAAARVGRRRLGRWRGHHGRVERVVGAAIEARRAVDGRRLVLRGVLGRAGHGEGLGMRGGRRHAEHIEGPARVRRRGMVDHHRIDRGHVRLAGPWLRGGELGKAGERAGRVLCGPLRLGIWGHSKGLRLRLRQTGCWERRSAAAGGGLGRVVDDRGWDDAVRRRFPLAEYWSADALTINRGRLWTGRIGGTASRDRGPGRGHRFRVAPVQWAETSPGASERRGVIGLLRVILVKQNDTFENRQPTVARGDELLAASQTARCWPDPAGAFRRQLSGARKMRHRTVRGESARRRPVRPRLVGRDGLA